MEVSQFTARPLIPIEPKNAGTRPMGASRMNLRTVPMTISGVTIPRKIIDLTIAAPRTLWRSIARNRPMNIVNGRWSPIQIRLLIKVPHGGPVCRQSAFTVCLDPMTVAKLSRPVNWPSAPTNPRVSVATTG